MAKNKKALTCYICEKPLKPSEALCDEDAHGRESFCQECYDANVKQEAKFLDAPCYVCGKDLKGSDVVMGLVTDVPFRWEPFCAECHKATFKDREMIYPPPAMPFSCCESNHDIDGEPITVEGRGLCATCAETKPQSTAIRTPKIEKVEAPTDATEHQKQFVEWLNKFRQTGGSLN